MTLIKVLVLNRACGAIESCLFVGSFLSCFLQNYPILTLPSKGTYLFMTCRASGSSKKGYLENYKGGQSTKFLSEATDMETGIISAVYRDLLCGQGISLKVIGGILKAGLLKQS